MPRVHKVKKARKDYPNHGIKKGETYYWWKFRFGGKRMSKTPPVPQQLTQSDFQIAIYDIQDSIEAIDQLDGIEVAVDDIKEQLQSLLDEQQEKLDNMPEQLQDSSDSGMLLQERIDQLEEAISDIENIDVDWENRVEEKVGDECPDEKEMADEIADDLEGRTDEDKAELIENAIEAKKDELREVAMDEVLQDIIDEIQGINLP